MLVRKQWAVSHIFTFSSRQDVTIRHTVFSYDSNSFEIDGQYVTFVTVLKFLAAEPEYCSLWHTGWWQLLPSVIQDLSALKLHVTLGKLSPSSQKEQYMSKANLVVNYKFCELPELKTEPIRSAWGRSFILEFLGSRGLFYSWQLSLQRHSSWDF
jgi:hypothetical protein